MSIEHEGSKTILQCSNYCYENNFNKFINK